MTGAGSGKPRNWFRPWLYPAVAALVFLAVILGRWALERPTPLERLIAAGEPDDHLHQIAADGGTVYAGTHLGLLFGRPGRTFRRVAGVAGDVVALNLSRSGSLLAAVAGTGLLEYYDGSTRLLLPGDVRAVVSDPADSRRILALQPDRLMKSDDGGSAWSVVAEWANNSLLALAMRPEDGSYLVAGDLTGQVFVSRDGGGRWERGGALQGTISALAFDPAPPHPLWAAAGGRLLVSEDGGMRWRAQALRYPDRIVTAIAFPVSDQVDGLLAATPNGFIYTQPK